MFDKVKEVIVETLNCEEEMVTMETDIYKDLGADSLDAVELSLALEEAFQITIDEDSMAKIKTVADIVNYIENN